jgi:hypothetical protein
LIRRNLCRTSYAAFLLEEISAGPKTQPFEEEMSEVQIYYAAFWLEEISAGPKTQSEVQICSVLIGRNFRRSKIGSLLIGRNFRRPKIGSLLIGRNFRRSRYAAF